MAKQISKSILLGQNFLKCPRLARMLVQDSNITPTDVVYEIGPGRGILTRTLAQAARRVVAIEKDPILARDLQKQFRHVHNVQIVAGDFLQHHVCAKEYKVFASIPYNTTADIMRKLVNGTPPAEAYLIMQKEAAEKFAGCPIECQFSILLKPTFHVEIVRHLCRHDFRPIPKVESALLHILKREQPLLHYKDRRLYRAFVRYGFRGRKKDLKLTFKSIFTHKQWKLLSKELAFPMNARPSELSFAQWLGLFDCFKHKVPRQKQALVSRG